MIDSEITLDWRGDAAKALVFQAADMGIGAGAELVARRARQSMTSASPSAAGSPPGVSGGASGLKGSVTHVRIGPMDWAAGTNVFYGRIQEYGGIFYSTKKSFTIPLNTKAKNAMKAVESVRSIKGLTYIKTKKGAILAKVIGGKRARVEPWFFLTKKINLPARPWLRPAFRQLVVSGELNAHITRRTKANMKALSKSLVASIVSGAQSQAGGSP